MLQDRYSSGLLQSFSPARQRIMMAVMILFFLLQVFRRLTGRKYDDAGAGYHKQKVRHGFHLPSAKFRGGMGVKPAPCLPAKPTENTTTLYFALNKSIFAFNLHQKTFLCIEQRKVFESREVRKPEVSGKVGDSVPHAFSFTGYALAARESRSARPAPSRRRRRKSRPTCSQCPARRAQGRRT